MPPQKFDTIDEYIISFPKDIQQKLQQVRSVVKKAVPVAEEKISYGIPTFTLNGRYLIYFAAYKYHIALYPVPNIKEFENDFRKFKTSGKGTIQFPLDKPMPVSLITKLVKYMKKRNEEKN